MLIKPHGSPVLCPLLIPDAFLKETTEKIASLKKVTIDSRALGDLLMLGMGAFTPLSGFMGREDWYHVCHEMKTKEGLFWPIPITLSIDKSQDSLCQLGSEVALFFHGRCYGIIKITEKYQIDKEFECQSVFGTKDFEHPGVKMLMEQGDIYIAGSVQVLTLGEFFEKYPELLLTPMQTRKLFEARAWKTITAFQTRNPMHRAHEYLVRTALEISDGVFIHSVLGEVKLGDIPGAVCAKAISALIEHYFPKNSLIQGGYPFSMRYAGPREALLHALFRQNFGCSHMIIGRDHAGVKDYYTPYAAQAIFDDIPAGALAIQPLKMSSAFWCEACEEMASLKTCPHAEKDRLSLSGTALRAALSQGADIPLHFSRPEVLAILRDYYAKFDAD